MTFAEYRNYDATGLAELVRNKQVSPQELLQLAIQRMEEVNPRINAVINPLLEMAEQMAAAVSPEQPFAGVPFLIKDLNLYLKGIPTSEGNRAYRNKLAEQDSHMLRRLREAGLLFLGKTNTPEFGLTPFTEPEAFGPTRNPWNPGHSAGGSSGGSAAAVAAGIVPLATASDGGGSIRIPASNCGLFGLKPSRGRVSLGPQIGEGWGGAVNELCVSRSVRDTARVLDILQGYEPGDPYGAPTPIRPYVDEVGADPGKLRIGFSTQHTLGHAIDPECIAAIQHTAKLLTDLGHHVEEVPLPYRKEDLTELFLIMVSGETSAGLRHLGEYLGRPVKPSDVEANNYLIGLLGQSFSASDYAWAMRGWNELSHRLANYHTQYDLLLTPVASMPPFPIGSLQATPSEKRLVNFINRFNLKGLLRSSIGPLADKIYSYIPYTPLANMAGQPSMSVPLHWTPGNLPVGSMFTADFGREDVLLRLASQLESAQPWFNRVPEL